MQYMLLLHIDEEARNQASPEEIAIREEGYKNFGAVLTEAGVFRGGQRLQWGPTATNLKRMNKKLVRTDGPFTETKEQLAGFCVIEVPDLATALEWAAKCPVVDHGHVEVRPLWGDGHACGA